MNAQLKTSGLLLFFCFCIPLGILAQQTTFQPSTKFGKPSDEELNMTTYAPDTAATAIVLNKKGVTYYELISNEFEVVYCREMKIKILKPEGTSYADVEIPYYDDNRKSNIREMVTQLEAFSYNMENGKMVKTKMKKEFVFKERYNDKYMQLKFSIPGVKAGTVIEYKYKLTSNVYSALYDWDAQQSIPVLRAEYDITVPEYFRFSLDMRGQQKVEHKESQESLRFTINYGGGQTEDVTCTGRHLNFLAEQLPALRGDSYVWCPSDYSSKVEFELQSVNFPNSFPQSFTTTWEKIDELLLKDNEFGGMLKMKNPFRDLMPVLKLDQMETEEEKLAAIFTLLKSNVSWNEKYALYSTDVKKAVKEGMGSNADINFILMSMLRDAGFQCMPIVMSRRDRGIVPYTHPSLDKLNTFIVGVVNADGTLSFLDGSIRNGYINVLPPVLLVTQARMITEAAGDKWIDLTQTAKSQIRSVVNAAVDPEGIIQGTRLTRYTGEHASGYRQKFASQKDSAEFISNLETEENIKVNTCVQKGLKDFSPHVTETIAFEKTATVNDDFIYLNPLIFLHTSKNPFTQEERMLPVEFSYPEQLVLSVTLTIPEGYQVEELPKPLLIRLENNGGMCRYIVNKVDGNKVSVNYQFTQNSLLFPSQQYLQLKSFWGAIAEKNNELIVLKKVES